MYKECLFCGSVFIKDKRKSFKNWNNETKFCCKKCYWLSITGIIKNPDKPIKVKKIRRKPDTAHLHKVEVWEKIRQTMLKKKGGVSTQNAIERHSSKFRIWRTAVFERDNFTCQHCSIRGKYLHPHHIKPFCDFVDLRFDVNNGITLCSNCHQQEHRKIKLSRVY